MNIKRKAVSTNILKLFMSILVFCWHQISEPTKTNLLQCICRTKYRT